VELYSALSAPAGHRAKVLARCREELDRADSILWAETTRSSSSGASWCSSPPRGQFAEGAPEKEADDPKIGRAPVLFLSHPPWLRHRDRGNARRPAVREDLPLALLKIVA